MALSVSTVFEVRTTGSDTNGGGFVTGASGTDWSQQDAAQYSVTDGVTAGTTTITSATANFGTDVVGNIIYVQGGTGSVTAGWYQITARTNSTTITVDRSTGLTAGTGVTLKIGGALATPGLGVALATVSGIIVYIKYGTYNLTTSTAGSGGPMLCASNIRVAIIGYQNTRGDRTARPIISWASVGDPGSTSYIWATQGNAQQSLHNVELDGNNTANVSGVNVASSSATGVWDCIARNFSATSQFGFSITTTNIGCTNCYAYNCKSGFGNGKHYGCVAENCGTGFASSGSAPVQCSFCIARNCTGSGFSWGTSIISVCFFCISDGNTGDGFTAPAAQTIIAYCVATNNGGYGFNTASNQIYMEKCASYNNTSGRRNVVPLFDLNAITLTANPWVNTGDYRPNSIAGGGILLRYAGLGVFGQNNNRDVGAVQHTDQILLMRR